MTETPSQIPRDTPLYKTEVELEPELNAAPALGGAADEKPEFVIAGAFVGSFVVAKVLRRLVS